MGDDNAQATSKVEASYAVLLAKEGDRAWADVLPFLMRKP